MESLGKYQESIDDVKKLMADMPAVLFAYLFGSCARGESGPLSDIDLAVFLREGGEPFAFRLKLMVELSRLLKAEKFDLVTLNDAPPVLRYEVIRDGRVVKEDKSRRVEFETRTLGEYLDMAHMRDVQRRYLKEQLGGTRGQ